MMALVELRNFFDRAVRASFRDLALHDEAAAGYLAELLTRFARTEQLFPRGITGQRLETVVDLLLETQALWQEGSFSPEREVAVRRHIGDYTLFMLGVFRERVERMASAGYYVMQGRRGHTRDGAARVRPGPRRGGGAGAHGARRRRGRPRRAARGQAGPLPSGAAGRDRARAARAPGRGRAPTRARGARVVLGHRRHR